MAQVQVSKAARRDIEAIARYTQKEWGTAQRRRYLDGLNEQFLKLAVSPYIAAERTEFEPPVRIQAYGKHLIVYLVDQRGVLIVRVLHARMDVTSHI